MAAFDITQISPYACGSGEFLFTNLSTIAVGEIAEYVWHFGDGTPDVHVYPPASADITHNFTYSNTFHVTLTVISTGGCSDTYSDIVVITNMDYDVDFEYERLVCDTLQFTDLTIPPIGYYSVQWFWDFGDESISTWPNPTHVYDTAGV